jgi:hypothetical protein
MRVATGFVAAAVMLAGFVLAGEGSSRAAVLPTLYVNYVGTNCTFTITNDSGANVSSIAPGSYQITLSATDFVSCPNKLPNFQLAGPGVSIQTPIDNGTGAAADYTAVFQPSSTYVAQDLNQPLSVITFTTLSSGSAAPVSLPTNTLATTTSASTDPIGTASGPKSTPATFRGTLDGVVSSAGRLTLKYKGKAVGELTAGKYTFSIVDHSKTGGFLVQEPPKAAKTLTSSGFVGSRKVSVELTTGQAIFYPTFVAKKEYFIVVAAH